MPSTPVRLVADVVVPATGDTVWHGGAVDIGEDGRIVAAGPETDLPAATAERHDVGGLLMPGFVNAHAHTPMTLVRSVGDGAALDSWLKDHVWPRETRMTPDDAAWGMRLGVAEMLLAGVTTTYEMYLFEDLIAEAAAELGQRVVACGGIFSGLLDGDDPSRRLDALDAARARFADHDLVTIGYGPHSLYDLPPAALTEIGRRAVADGVPVTIHLEETEAERELVIDRHGRTATEVLAEIGFLAARPLCAHGVWLSERDQELLREHDAAVVHCPSSNLKLGSGIAPIAAMRERGVTVALGTDGPASNDRLDLWDELRLAGLLARGSTHDPTVARPGDVLAWGTRTGGHAIGQDDVGHLGAGARADLIRIDLDQPAFTPGLPDDLLTHLVFSGSSRHVTDVWVGGRQVVEAKELVTGDLAEIRAESVSIAQRLAA
ncbi:MAG: amidohydrolase [Actinomycetota bacterium]